MVSVPPPLGETSSGGEPLSRVMPLYPAAMRSACPALEEIDVAVYVDSDGKVSDVLGVVIDMALPPWDTFFAAVRPAVLQWRFEPLLVAHWAADAAGNAHAVDGKAYRFTREYSFRFACHDGRTSVSGETLGRAYTR